MTRVVAIHQPNFFPWLGYFHKIASSDAFIFLDDVQLPSGSSWCNRVKLLVRGEARWQTAPIMRKLADSRPRVCDVELQSDYWREKMVKTIVAHYRKAPHFEEVLAFVEPLILNRESNLSRYNANSILAFARALGLVATEIFWSSKLPHDGSATELLISLTKAVRADIYMCGAGADGYQDDAAFHRAATELRHQRFVHPSYMQVGNGPFVAGLSIIDAVMNLGWRGVNALLTGAVP